MTKDAGAFLSIGELASTLNVKTHILRYWEDQFPMLQPLKRAGNRRHYRPEDVELARVINRLLNEQGYTVKGARKYLSDKKRDKSSNDATESAANASINSGADHALIADVMDELRSVRDKLQAALAAS